MRLRKFEILSIEEEPGSSGPLRFFKIHYKAIKDKEWINGSLYSNGRTKEEAYKNAMSRFGGIN